MWLRCLYLTDSNSYIFPLERAFSQGTRVSTTASKLMLRTWDAYEKSLL